jgi:hypothetical protein
MFKFLLYSFLFYFLFRFLFGGILKIKVYNHVNHHHYPPRDEAKKPEGTITIDKKVEKSKSSNGNKLGEYVDFEEVNE